MIVGTLQLKLIPSDPQHGQIAISRPITAEHWAAILAILSDPIKREQSPVDEQDQSAQPCIYCGSKTSVCDQSIAHPAKSGKDGK